MTARRVRQRQRILAARSVAERIARADQAAAALARDDAAALAVRLAREVSLCAAGCGPTSGSVLAAQAALQDRLRLAAGQLSTRERVLAAEEAMATSRAMSARQARRSAETLVERAERLAQEAAERRLAMPPRRVSGPRP